LTPSRLRRALAVAGLLLLAGVLLLLLGWFPQEPLRRLAEAQLRIALGPSASIRRLHVVPGTLSVEIEGLTLRGPGYEAEIPAAEARLGAETLLGGAVSIRSISIHEPRLLLRPAPAAAAPATGPAGPTRPFVIRSLNVDSGTVAYDDPTLGGRVTVRGIHAEGGLGEGSLEVTSPEGLWQRPHPLALGPTRVRVKLSRRLDLELETLELGTRGSRVTASGRLGRLGALAPDVTATLRLDLSELSALERTPPLSGLVEGQAKVSGTKMQATLAGRELRVAAWPLQKATLELAQDGRNATGKLGLDLLGGHVDADVRLVATTIDASLHAAALDLDRLRQQLAPGASALAGTLSADASSRGDLNGGLATQLSLTARARQGDLALLALGEASGTVRARQPSLDLVWNVAVQSEGSAAAGRLAVKGTAQGPLPPAVDGVLEGTVTLGREDVSLNGSFSGRGPQNNLRLEARGLGGSASAVLEASGALLQRLEAHGESLRLDAASQQVGGRAGFTLTASGPVDRLTGTGRVVLEDVSWNKVAAGNLSLGVDARDGEADLSFEAPVFHAVGRGHLGRGPKATLTATAQLAETPFAPLAPLLPLPLDGHVSAQLDVSVPVARPAAAEVRAKVEALELTSGRISAQAQQPFTAELVESRLSLAGLRLAGQGFTVAAEGGLGFGAPAAVDVTVTSDADLAQLPFPEGWQASGNGHAEVRLTGTTARPKAGGQLTFTQLSVAGTQVPPLQVAEARIELAGDTAVIPGFSATLAGGTATVEGRVPLAALARGARARPDALRPEEGADLHLSWTGIEAQALVTALHAEGSASLSGTLAGDLRLEGGLAGLAEARATLTIPATELQVEAQSLRLEPASVQLARSVVTTDGLALSAAGGTLRLSGHVDLARRTMEASSQGALDLRALSPFVASAALTGTADVDVSVSGSLDAPRPRGSLRIHDATMRIRDIPQALTELNTQVVLEETRLRIVDGSAVYGGGPISLSGTAALKGASLTDVDVALQGKEIALRYPPGLKSRVSADVSLKGRSGDLLLSGSVQTLGGLYDLDLALDASMRAPAARPVESAVLRGIKLDLTVEIANPIAVRNSQADLRTKGSLTFRGSLEDPRPFARLEIVPDGKIFLQDHVFRITSGELSYDGTWEPKLRLEARSEKAIRPTAGDENAGNSYYIIVRAEGTTTALRLSFDADPHLDEAQAMSLLMTGQTQSATLTSTRIIAEQQAAQFLAGRLTRGLKPLGLDEVSLQPELLARETSPGARFTFGKQFTSRFKLIYSLPLNVPEGRFLRLEANGPRSTTLAVQRDDNAPSTGQAGQAIFVTKTTYEVGQQLRIGGPPSPAAAAASESRVKLQAVRFEGNPPLPEAELQKTVRARPQRTLGVFDVQDDADRLRDRLVAQGHLEAEVSGRIEDTSAVFVVRAGPRFRWQVNGMDRPPNLDRVMRKSLYTEEALENGRLILLKELRRRGHLRAVVSTRSRDAGDGRVLEFSAMPGPVLTVSAVVFPGAKALSERELLKAAGGAAELLVAPQEAGRGIRAAYLERHYLGAVISKPRVLQDGPRLRIEVPIEEGQPAQLKAVRFQGAQRPEAELLRIASLQTAVPYDEARARAAVERLVDSYFSQGYPSVRVTPIVQAAGADYELVFEISEGERVVVGSVNVTGLGRTHAWVPRRQIALKPGDPLDPRRLARLQRDLSDLRIFSRVATSVSSENPANVAVELQEEAPLIVRYDLRYSDQDKWGGLLDAEARSLFGSGITLGGRYDRSKDVQQAKLSLQIPPVGLGSFTAVGTRAKETLSTNPGLPPNTRLTRKIEAQDKLELGDHWNLLLGANARWVHSEQFEPTFGEFLVFDTFIAAVNTSLLRDTRDNALDPRRGRLLSLNLELAPPFLGSSLLYAKGLAQASIARSFGPSLTWAQGYRFGLAHGINGQDVDCPNLFRLGGANSLRGFAANSVAPIDPLCEPGGRAVVLLSEELRYRHSSGLGAAVFYDGGNVFAQIKDLSLDLRHSAGLGLRYESPVGLLRLDLGFPLNRKPEEKRYQWFFSLGQAF
jgi:outer membrane protein assembly factor BamA/autotransporter translocation and assembly factor TamB